MKIREITDDPKGPSATPQKTVNNLFDSNLLAGVDIDDEDLKPLVPRHIQPESAAVNIPTTKLSVDEDGWFRQEVPSMCVPYKVDEILVRPLTVPMLARVHAAQVAAQKNDYKAFTMMVDALAPTIKSFDIRDLTVPDWHSHLYWLRLNSYPRTPMTIPWTSRYGNELHTRVTSSNFEFQMLEMTRERLGWWRSQGITFPTVRDMEVLNDPDLSDATRFEITYAQYIYLEGPVTADTMKRKIEKLEELGADIIGMINQFSTEMTHGVIEQVVVEDVKFDLDNAIAYMEEQLPELQLILDTAIEKANSVDDQAMLQNAISFGLTVDAQKQELAMLKRVKENNGRREDGTIFKPEKEVVALAKADAAILFP